ncbi:hypothetical protein C9374_010640 [Naegleria lovaniensis]|uniref:F-box domain-containing protein n=1 Tax=Naegleria lovaniensis TaxID=51637 RepID=A0AA88GDP8_NAELO|nr:uncharacterized protein C9374_010640 [Naegleria lovaniensis]KAG2374621.1 hypothetical protein C9374_010640 [Naegleria lovaniensis]
MTIPSKIHQIQLVDENELQRDFQKFVRKKKIFGEYDFLFTSDNEVSEDEEKEETVDDDVLNVLENYYETTLEKPKNNKACDDDEEQVMNHDRCFYIGSVLNYLLECKPLIEATRKLGYLPLDQEYPKEYRNSERVLVISKKLADLLWRRIKPHINEDDLKGVRPYGFGNEGHWIPIGIHECLRFNRYAKDAFFKPHQDAKFVKNNDEQSIFTVLIYLDGGEAGTTLMKKVHDPQQKNPRILKFKKLATVQPQMGAALIFNHDLYHAGDLVQDMKYVLRTEIIFKRVDSESVYQMNYRADHRYLLIKKLLNESNMLEKEGKVREATTKYIEAQNIHTSISHSLMGINNSKKVSFIETHVPEELFAHIFSFLNAEEISKTLLHVNREMNRYARNSALWRELYARKWKIHDAENERNESTITKNWYHIFISRANMEKYFSPVLLDLGMGTYRYAVMTRNSSTFRCGPTIIGKPWHNHFDLNGYGFEDYVAGDRFDGHCEKMDMLSKPEGNILDRNLLKIFVYQLYKDDLQVNLREHPLVISHPVSWTSKEKEEFTQDMFSLGIPFVCLVDSTQMLSLNYEVKNFLRIHAGTSGIRCIPVLNGEPFQTCQVIEYPPMLTQLHHYYGTASEEMIPFERFLQLILISPKDDDETRKQYYEYEGDYYLNGWYWNVSGHVRAALGEWYWKQIVKAMDKLVDQLLLLLTNQKEEEIQQMMKCVIFTGGAFMDVRNLAKRLQDKYLQKLHVEFEFGTVKFIGEVECNDEEDDSEAVGMDILKGMEIFAGLSTFKSQCQMNPVLASDE